jgi:RimJ/RimL family protein N-acetyltransferase
MGSDCGRYLVSIHREAQKFLERMPFRRIEAHVDVGFEQGARWMKMLGFELEAYKRAFRPDGADMLEFVRIK